MIFGSHSSEQKQSNQKTERKRIHLFATLCLAFSLQVFLVLACNSKAKVQWESTERSAIQEKLSATLGNGEVANLYRSLSAQLNEDERKPLNALIEIIVDRSPSKADKNATALSALKAVDSLRGTDALRPKLKTTIESIVDLAKLFDRSLKPLAEAIITAKNEQKIPFINLALQLARTAKDDTTLLSTIESSLPFLKGDAVVSSSEAWAKLPNDPTVANAFLSQLFKVAPALSHQDIQLFIARALETQIQTKIFEGLRDLSANDPQLGAFVRVQNAAPADALDTFTRLMSSYSNTATPEATRTALTDALKKALVLKSALLPSFLTTVEQNLTTADSVFSLRAFVNSIDRSGGEAFYTQPQFTSKSLSALAVPQCRIPGGASEKITFSFRWSKSGSTVVDWTAPSSTRQHSSGQLFALDTTAQCSVRIFLDGTKIAELSSDLVTVRSMPPTFASGEPPTAETLSLKQGEILTYTVSERDAVEDLNTFYRITTQPKNGVLSQTEIGTFEYKPLAAYTGPDVFKFVACNSDDMCSSDKVINIVISAGDRAPKLERMVVPEWNSVVGGIRMSQATDLNNIKLIINDEENINSSCGIPNVIVTPIESNLFDVIGLSGTYPNCILRLKPKTSAQGLGTTRMTLTLDDQVNPAVSSIFSVTVVETTPQWANSSAALTYTVNKNSTGNTIQLDTASDPDANLFSTPQGLSYVIASSPAIGSLTAVPSVSATGAGSILYSAPQGRTSTQGNETTSFTYKICDTVNPPVENCTAAKSISINIINNAPTISEIASQTVDEDADVENLTFTLVDADDTRTCAQVSVSSSNTALIPNENISITGAAQNCMMTISPVDNGNGGPVTITLGLTHSTPVERRFFVNVTPVNDSPSAGFAGATPSVTATTGSVPDTAPPMTYTHSHSQLIISEDPTPLPNNNITLVRGVDVDASDTTAANGAPQKLFYFLEKAPTRGTLSTGNAIGFMNVASQTDPQNGLAITYVPKPNENGLDYFVYKICDSLMSCTGLIYAPISITAQNDAPEIVLMGDVVKEVSEKTLTFTLNLPRATDPDGNTLSAVLVSGPTQGSISGFPATITADTHGVVTYSPEAGKLGLFTITYKICDDSTPSQCTQDFSMTVNVLGKAPVFNGAQVNTVYNIPDPSAQITIALEGAIDPDAQLFSPAQTLIYFVSLSNNQGTLDEPSSVPSTGTGTVNYTPDGESGVETLKYKVCDNLETCSAEKTITLNIGALTYPVESDAGDRRIELGTNSTATITLSQFIDPVSTTSNLAYTVTQNSNQISDPSALDPRSATRSVTYTRPDIFAGTEVLKYRACAEGETPQRCSPEISIEVVRAAQHSQPVLQDGDTLVLVSENPGTGGGTFAIQLASASSINNAALNLTYQILQGPENKTGVALVDGPVGTLGSLPADAKVGGTLSYTLRNDLFSGTTDRIVYQVCQNSTPSLCSESRTISIVVTANNDPTKLTQLALDPDAAIPPLKLSGAGQGNKTFNLSFNLADSDSTVSCSAVTVLSTNMTMFAVPTVSGGGATTCTVPLASANNESGDSDISFSLNGTTLKINSTSETSFRATALALDANDKAIHVCENVTLNVEHGPQGTTATIQGAAKCKDPVASGWDPTESLDPTKIFRAVDTSKLPDPRKYCTGIKLFGYQGMALCGEGTEPLNLHRDVGSLLLNSSTEPSLAYRLFPDPSKDHDAQLVRSSGVLKLATRPNVVCGTGATVGARITDCTNANGAFAYWDGSAKGHGSQGLWRLVTVKPISGADCSSGCTEVWRDERTGLLWSDVVVDASETPIDSYNWCKASGSSNAAGAPGAEDDPSDICDSQTHQGQNTGPSPKPTSLCAEDAAFLSRDTRQKLSLGDLDLQSTPKIRWWLPSRSDYLRAERNGLRFVLPNINNTFWAATVSSKAPANAWVFNGQAGGKLTTAARDTTNKVRCVGSP